MRLTLSNKIRLNPLKRKLERQLQQTLNAAVNRRAFRFLYEPINWEIL
jgi:hypothetical protein